MRREISEEWIRNAAAMEEGCSVSAGSPLGFYRSVEIAHAKKHALEGMKPFVVFFKAGEFGHMTRADWLRVVRYGVAAREGYEFVAKVMPSGHVFTEPSEHESPKEDASLTVQEGA